MAAATVAIVIAAVTAVASATGAVIQADSSRKQANYNADVAEQNAVAVKKQTDVQEKIHRENVRKILATQRALYGKSGLSMTGSPLPIPSDLRKFAVLSL